MKDHRVVGVVAQGWRFGGGLSVTTRRSGFSEREMNKLLVLCELAARANYIHGHSVEGTAQPTMSVLTLSGFSQFGAMKVWDNVQELLNTITRKRKQWQQQRRTA